MTSIFRISAAIFRLLGGPRGRWFVRFTPLVTSRSRPPAHLACLEALAAGHRWDRAKLRPPSCSARQWASNEYLFAMLSELKKVKHNLRALQGILSDRAALGQFEHRANANHWPLRPLASSTHGQSILKARMSAPHFGSCDDLGVSCCISFDSAVQVQEEHNGTILETLSLFYDKFN